MYAGVVASPAMTTARKSLPENMLPAKLLASWERYLRQRNRRPATIADYSGAVRQFFFFAEDEHFPGPLEITREHVSQWIEHLYAHYPSVASVRNRYMGVRHFYDWLVTVEEEMAVNPFGDAQNRRVKPPEIEEKAKDVVSEENMRKASARLDNANRWRDAALLAVLYDTGMRASELADLPTEALDMETGVIMIEKTKGKRIRYVRLSPESLKYLDRYQRKPRADEAYLFNGTTGRGKLTRSGVYGVVRTIFEEMGIPNIGAHDLRHTSATHVALSGVMSESDAMELYGWKEPDMWRHYTAQARKSAALKAHEAASPMARLSKKK